MRKQAIENAMIRTISTYQRYFQSVVNTDEVCKRNFECGHYDYVPAWDVGKITKTFLDLIDLVIDECDGRRRPSLLDAGCGIGNIMLLAKSVGFKTTGIEYDRYTAEVAMKLTNQRVHVGDISTYTQYHKYDVIYYYIPIKSNEKRLKFFNCIAHGMRRGAYIVSYGNYLGSIGSNEAFKHIKTSGQGAWKKVGNFRGEVGY